MPLGAFESQVLRVIAVNRNPESYVAGATVLHQAPDSPRTSRDVDVFHDTAQSLAAAVEADGAALIAAGFEIALGERQPTFQRAEVTRGERRTKIEWACDSLYRFFPIEPDVELGWRLNFWDAATNKLLAFVGRMKLRDYLDVIFLHEKHLHLGALAWAAAAKDPGLSPERIIDLGGWQTRMFSEPAEARRVAASLAVDLVALREKWSAAAAEAFALIGQLPPAELGCFYLDSTGRPVCPDPASADFAKLTRHYGSVRGAWPQIVE